MRTTLTLEDDVAASLERLRKVGDDSLKSLVNRALRLGLREMEEERSPREPFVQETLSAGECRLNDLDDIGEVLTLVEGDDRR